MSSISLNKTKIILLVLLVSTVNCRFVTKRSEKDAENEVTNIEKIPKIEETKNVEVGNVQIDAKEEVKKAEKLPEIEKKAEEVKKENNKTTSKEGILKKAHQEDEKKRKNLATKSEGKKAVVLEATSITPSDDNPRSSRTIPPGTTPEMILEKLKNKLKESRINLERKASAPLAIIEPNTAVQPTLLNINIHNPAENIPKDDIKKPLEPNEETITPSLRNNNMNEDHGTSGTTLRENSEDNEQISHLLHVREEINKIRHMMQVLRDQQLRQKFGSQFPLSRNLTEEESKDLTSIVDKLKEEGKISTKPINKNEGSSSDVQSHPPEASKLIEDVQKLKQSVLSFAKQVGGSKIPINNIEDLEKQIQQQREEIENLKKLVDELQPPKNFPTSPAMLKHPTKVKTDLHEELRTLQEILNELLKKEEAKDQVQARNQEFNRGRSSSKASTKPDEEIETIMKVFQTLRSEGRQTNPLETKIEKLEREIKDLDHLNQRTRHDILLQRLENQIKSLQSTVGDKAKSGKDPLAELANMEKQLKDIKPQSRDLDIPANIEKELDNLQNEINLMAMKNLQKSGTSMSSRQLESLFSDILNQPSDDLDHIGGLDAIKDVVKPPEKHIEVIHEPVHHIEPEIVHTVVHGPPKIQYPQQPIFQLPFCLQKYAQSQYYPAPNHPFQTGPYQIQPAVHHQPMSYNHGYHEPIRTGGHYSGYKKGPMVYNQGYREPIKTGGYKYEPTGYNHGYAGPIKSEEHYKGYHKEPIGYNHGYGGPVKTGGYKNEPTGYNHGYRGPIKSQEHYKEPTGYNHGYEGQTKTQQHYKEPTGYNHGYEGQTKTQEHYKEPTGYNQGYGKSKSEGQYVEYKEESAEYNDVHEKPITNEGYDKPAETHEYGNEKQGQYANGEKKSYEEPIKTKGKYYEEPVKAHEYNKPQGQYGGPKEQIKIDSGYDEYKKPEKNEEYKEEPIKSQEYGKSESQYGSTKEQEYNRSQEQYGVPKEELKTEPAYDEYKEPAKNEEYKEPIESQEYSKSEGQYGSTKGQEYKETSKNKEENYEEPTKDTKYSEGQYSGQQEKPKDGYDEYKPTKNKEVYSEEPIKSQEYNKPQGQYGGPKEVKVGYSNNYQKPVKQTDPPISYETAPQEPINVQITEYDTKNEYKNKYEEPTKSEYKPTEEPMKQYGTKEETKYNKEGYPKNEASYGQKSEGQYPKSLDIMHHIPIVHQIYKPKAIPVKIEYHHQADQYGYPESQYDMLKPPYSKADIDEEINNLSGIIRNLNEKMYVGHKETNYDVYPSQDYKRKKRAVEDNSEMTLVYDELKQRLASLRAALEAAPNDPDFPNSLENETNPDFQRTAYEPSYQPSSYQPNSYQPYALKYKKKQKFDDLFIKIVKFIMHKLEISAPHIVKSLFDGDAYEYDTDNYEDSYKSSNHFAKSASEDGYESSAPSNLFGGIFNSLQGFPGLLGIIPTILLKLLSGFSSFLTVLKRNSFIRNFLFPGGLILAVDGLIAILAWWLSTDENHNFITFQNSSSSSLY